LALDRIERDGLDGPSVRLGAGIGGLDLDRVIVDGVPQPAAMAVCTLLNSYTEISVSGRGLHVLFLTSLDVGGRRRGGMEIYTRDRHFTFSGNKVPGFPSDLRDVTDDLPAVLPLLFGPDAMVEPVNSDTGEIRRLDVDPAHLLERAERAGLPAHARRLLQTTDLGAYPSQSEADYHLVCDLLSAGLSPSAAYTIIATSPRGEFGMRRKGARRRDYWAYTIARAIARHGPDLGRSWRVPATRMSHRLAGEGR
jgi:putative DNA primase/helicase